MNKVKVLILMFLCASIIDASLTIVGLHLNWHEEGNAIIAYMIELTGSITAGVLIIKASINLLVILALPVMYAKHRWLSTFIILLFTFLTMSAGLLWLS